MKSGLRSSLLGGVSGSVVALGLSVFICNIFPQNLLVGLFAGVASVAAGGLVIRSFNRRNNKSDNQMQLN